jgi:hypothetical protein
MTGGSILNASATDIHRTVEYRADRWLVGWLPYALLLAAFGLYMAIFEYGRHQFAGRIVLLIAAGFSLFLLYRLFNPGPSRLTLSPAGLQLHVGRRDVLIPWREIQSIDTTDLKVRNWGRGSALFPTITFHDCTLVKVSRPFYEEAIHVPSVFMQGPGWQGVFHAEGDSMRIALHHEQFSATSQDVRALIEARWRAFRGRSHPASRVEEEVAVDRSAQRDATDPASASNSARPDTRRAAGAAASALDDPIRFGGAVLVSTPWDMIKLAVALTALLVIGSNALGIWETAAQETRRLERAAAAEERRKEKEDRDRQKKKWDDTWKKFDDDMRRVHGDDFKR